MQADARPWHRIRSRPRALAALALGLATALGNAPLALAAPPPAFTPAVRLGFPLGDDWEPAVAADRFGHVYAVWSHYQGFGGASSGEPDPTCPTCASPHTVLQVSSDYGVSWSAPRALAPGPERQDDPQIVVDPVDGMTVYAAFMQNDKSSEYVAKSTNFGATWRTVLVEPLRRGTDKDILAVRGQDIYLVYHTQQKTYASISHDGGDSWTTVDMLGSTAHFGVSLASGGAVDSNGVAYFGLNGVRRPGQAKGVINLYVVRSSDGGATWEPTIVDVSEAPPPCGCGGWDYWGGQIALAVDGANTVYALWNANRERYGPQRMFFARSTDGEHWTDPLDVSMAAPGVNHAFPAIVAGAAGDVRVAWTDDRNGLDPGGEDPNARWNVYYRSSTDGGAGWTDEAKLSSFVPGFTYKLETPQDGFLQPYGDYFELDIDALGRTVALWGEGNSYVGPGNVWFARQP
jgi:hypothetical protein